MNFLFFGSAWFTMSEHSESNGAPEWTRTTDLRLRSPLLYPAELPGRLNQYKVLTYINQIV